VFVGSARFDLRLRDAHSLKEKRAVLRSLITLLHQKFDCAVAEVDYQDVHQRAAVGVAVVSGSHFHAERVLREIERHVDTHPGAELLATLIDVTRPGD
jgi:hypothetical protein